MKKIATDSWVMGNSTDIKRSVAFYAKLGLKPFLRMPFYIEIKVPGGTVFGLHSKGKKGSRKKAATRATSSGWGIMLRVRDIRKTVSDLRKKKIPCGAVSTAPGGAMFSNLADPDGNRLTLLEIPGKKG